MKGRIVCLEGIEGAGKDTQAQLLSRRLQEEGFDTLIYSYPDYNSRYGQIMREYLDKKIELGIEELFFLNVLDKQKDKARLESDLKAGKIIIMNRYIFSVLAYQVAGGFDYQKAKTIIGLSGLPSPDIALYLEIPVELSLQRKTSQKKGDLDRFEESSAYLKKVKGVYDRIFKEAFGCSNWVRIDATAPVGKVHDRILLEVKKLLK